jgi:hypothetical protein
MKICACINNLQVEVSLRHAHCFQVLEPWIVLKLLDRIENVIVVKLDMIDSLLV